MEGALQARLRLTIPNLKRQKTTSLTAKTVRLVKKPD
jgi:hypothetical protein